MDVECSLCTRPFCSLIDAVRIYLHSQIQCGMFFFFFSAILAFLHGVPTVQGCSFEPFSEQMGGVVSNAFQPQDFTQNAETENPAEAIGVFVCSFLEKLSLEDGGTHTGQLLSLAANPSY